jgi:carboxymethylenebutenolidase
VRKKWFLLALAGIAAGLVLYRHAPRFAGAEAPSAMRVFLSDAEARQALNTTPRHREWVSVPLQGADEKKIIRVFLVYPERADRAPSVIVAARDEGASTRVRAAAISLAEQGYIAAVPDVLSGLAPNGGDADSFANAAEVSAALRRMSGAEMKRRMEGARSYAVSLAAADGQSATLEFDASARRLTASAHDRREYSLDRSGWQGASAFLASQTNNHPLAGRNTNMPEDHSMHIGMAMGQAAPKANTNAPLGYPRGKLAGLPAGVFTARSAILNSKMRKEFVDIPLGNGKLHTWVEYPDGEGKAPIVIVMQHGPGMDDWQRALADQLAQEGFIAIAADLHSGLGPNGGNYDSFQATDEVMRATARLTPEEMQRRYKTALEWGKKLPRWNGKAASIGFCMGGGNSFRFAGEVPELDAAISYYGGTPAKEIMAKIKAPVLAFYGEDDARVTMAAEPTKASMQQMGKIFEYYVYPHATHGFLEFQDLAGNPAATSDSWTRTIAFLRAHTK